MRSASAASTTNEGVVVKETDFAKKIDITVFLLSQRS